MSGKFEFFAKRDDKHLTFGCQKNTRKILFLPIWEENPDDQNLAVFLALNRGVFSLIPDELQEVREIFDEYEMAIYTYFALIVQEGDFPNYPYPKDILDRILTFPLNTAERTKVEAVRNQFTFIYLIRDRLTGLTKIGRSNNPENRLKQLKKQDTLMPVANDFFIIDTWEDYAFTEQMLHNKYQEKRVRGEWFNLSNFDIKEIQEVFKK